MTKQISVDKTYRETLQTEHIHKHVFSKKMKHTVTSFPQTVDVVLNLRACKCEQNIKISKIILHYTKSSLNSIQPEETRNFLFSDPVLFETFWRKMREII